MEMGHPFIDGYQYSILLQDMDEETLYQIHVANKMEALMCARKCINREFEKFEEEIQALIIDNLNRGKPIRLTLS